MFENVLEELKSKLWITFSLDFYREAFLPNLPFPLNKGVGFGTSKFSEDYSMRFGSIGGFPLPGPAILICLFSFIFGPKLNFGASFVSVFSFSLDFNLS